MSSSLQFIPDWFVRRDGLYMWHNDYYNNHSGGHWDDDDEDKCFEEELMSIAWHPNRVMDWLCQKTKRGGGSNR